MFRLRFGRRAAFIQFQTNLQFASYLQFKPRLTVASMEQPCTPPTNSSAPPADGLVTPPRIARHHRPPAETPEDGLVAPLTVHEVASWTDRAWYSESLQRMNWAEEQGWALLDQVSSAGGNEDLVARIHRMIDWIQDCFFSVVFPDPVPGRVLPRV